MMERIISRMKRCYAMFPVWMNRHGALAFMFVLVGVFSLLPVWGVRYLPLLDMPQHLSVIHILHYFDDPAFGYRQYLELDPMLTTYLLYYYGADLLAYVMSVESASKVFISLYILGLPLSVIYALRVFGKNQWLGLLAFPLAFSYPFYMGFVSYCLSMPLLIAGLGLWESLLRRPTRRRMILAGLHLPLLFFTHSLTFLLMMVIVALLLLFHEIRRPRLLLKRALLALPGLGLFLIWFMKQFAGGSGPAGMHEKTQMLGGTSAFFGASYTAVSTKLHKLPQNLTTNLTGETEDWILVYWLLIAFAFFLIGLRLARSNEPGEPSESSGAARQGWFYRSRLEIIVWIFFCLYFAFPMSISGVWAISPRIPILCALLLILLIHLPAASKWLKLAFVPVVLLGCVNGLNTYAHFLGFQKEVGPLEEVIAPLESGKKVFSLMYNRSSDFVSKSAYLHFACYIMLEKGGMTSFSFVRNPAVPIRQINPEAFPYPSEGGEWHPERFRFEVHGESYDYFLVRDTGKKSKEDLKRYKSSMQLIASAGSWAVYKNITASDEKREIRYEFRERIRSAHVRLEKGNEKPVACDAWKKDRWQCPVADWVHVGSEILTVKDTGTPCIWAHPFKERSLVIEYDDVAIQDELSGFVALTDGAIRIKANGAPVTMVVKIGGKLVKKIKHKNVKGIEPFRVDTKTLKGKKLPVTFEVYADDVDARHFCFDARIIEIMVK